VRCERTRNLGAVGERLVHSLAKVDPVVARGLTLHYILKAEPTSDG
jgi:hypothetical protein